MATTIKVYQMAEMLCCDETHPVKIHGQLEVDGQINLFGQTEIASVTFRAVPAIQMFTCPGCRETWALDQADINYHHGVLNEDHLTSDVVYSKQGTPHLFTAIDLVRGELGIELVREAPQPKPVSQPEGGTQMPDNFHNMHFFKILDELKELLKITDSAISSAAGRQQYDEVGRLSEQAKETTKLIEAVKALEDRFLSANAATGGRPAPQRPAPPRIKHVPPAPTPPRPRARRGEKTPESYFQIPILKALVQLGGAGRVPEVVSNVGHQMDGKLKAGDFGTVGNNEIRWQNTIKWCRNTLKDEGFLKNDSPRGVWEITEKGRQYLKSNDRPGRPTILRGD